MWFARTDSLVKGLVICGTASCAILFSILNLRTVKKIVDKSQKSKQEASEREK